MIELSAQDLDRVVEHVQKIQSGGGSAVARIYLTFAGSTGYEIQVGRLCFFWPYWRFILSGVSPRIYWD
jgi:hypothetical protein